MSVSNYTRILILSIIFSISWAVELPCNYVGDATMIDQNTGSEDHNDNPVPVGVCRTKYENNIYESEMFVCSPWGPYYFKFMTADCTGSTPNVSDVISGDYYCDGQSSSCNVFKVKTSPPANEQGCALGSGDYHEFVTLADRCWVEADRDCHDGQNGEICGNVTYKSAYASCNPITEQINYDEYKGIACDGDPTHSIDAVSKDCPEVPNGDGPPERQYIELSECGEIPHTSPHACSKVVGGHYIEEQIHGDHSHYRNESITAPMGYDTCTNRYRDGKYQSEMVWCSETLNRGFVGQWFNRTAPTMCNTPPDRVYQIEDPTEFWCNEAAGGCPSMMIRISDFEDKDGNAGCAFGNEWQEMIILTDECFYMDGDEGSVGRSVCSLDGGTGGAANFDLTMYEDMSNCQAKTNEIQAMNFDNNLCYSFDGDTFGTKYENTAGNWSFFQALDCEGTLINNNDIRPDCNFVRNARWYEPSQNENENQNERGDGALTLPIGMCQSKQQEDVESESESRMFMCTPWNTVVVVFWDDIGCGEGGGNLMYITDVMSTDYQCGKSSNCPVIKVEINPITDNDINNCANNATSWDEKNMIQSCTDGLVDGPGGKKFGSTMVSCDDTSDPKTLTYSIYGAPGCVGTPDMTVNADDGGCAFFGSDPTYVDLIECGTLAVETGSECSYIVNPVYNRTEENELKVRDGAFPLSTEICTTNYENGRSMSEMYFCDYASQLAFYARYNNSRGCRGEPSEINRIWSDVDMVCSGNEASRCSYVLVSSSESQGDTCEPSDRIEQAARIIEKCWPSVDDECSTDCHGSWMVDCDGNDVEVYVYGPTDYTCSLDPVKQVEVRENGCSEFDDNDGGQMWFQVHACTEGRDPTGVPTTQPTTDDYCETTNFRQWKKGSTDAKCYLCVCMAEGNDGLKNACDEIVNNIPEDYKDWVVDECGYSCEYDELRKKNDFACDCTGFECSPNASKGNMLKMFVSVVLGMFMWIIN